MLIGVLLKEAVKAMPKGAKLCLFIAWYKDDNSFRSSNRKRLPSDCSRNSSNCKAPIIKSIRPISNGLSLAEQQ